MDENAARKGKHLSLVLQAAERGGENQSVIIASKVGANSVLIRVMVVFKSESFIIDQFRPFHFLSHNESNLIKERCYKAKRVRQCIRHTLRYIYLSELFTELLNEIKAVVFNFFVAEEQLEHIVGALEQLHIT